MNRDYKKKVLWRYVPVTAMLLIVLAEAGCQSLLPSIELKPITENKIVPDSHLSQLKVGKFNTNSDEYRQYGVFVRECLINALPEKKLQLLSQADQDGSAGLSSQTPSRQITSQKQVISGNVSLSKTADPADNSKVAVQVEITFVLSDSRSGGIIRSVTLSQITARNSQEGIRVILQRFVDSYLAEIFPDSSALSSRLIKGWTKYDRQGRKSAGRGDYAGALVWFRKAIDARPDD
ncbi:MAG: hypothetical protein KAJ52_08410, partial [Sedimentisphaerales bacterium]|nr:hypothetical protein [Sedimentisphaerales bacterium]